jgi:hypothetical protein
MDTLAEANQREGEDFMAEGPELAGERCYGPAAGD